MAIVYIISAYKLPAQLVRLVRRLDGPDTTILIHVDRRTPRAEFEQMRDGLCGAHGLPQNIQFLERHNCYWGDFGHVRATLKGMHRIIQQNIPCDHAILLTGQDYPILPTQELYQFLERHAGRSFMRWIPLPDWNWDVMDRLECRHYRPFGLHARVPLKINNKRFKFVRKCINLILPGRRALPPGLEPFGGSGYWCLSGGAVQYIYNYVSAHPEIVNFFKLAHISDEHFFQTILLNSPLRDSIVNDDLRYIDWSGRDGERPAILGVQDIPALRTCGKLFARKFDSTTDSRILDLLDSPEWRPKRPEPPADRPAAPANPALPVRL